MGGGFTVLQEINVGGKRHNGPFLPLHVPILRKGGTCLPHCFCGMYCSSFSVDDQFAPTGINMREPEIQISL